ncbi:hypothetical protein FRC10_001903, partial [Ceratobasidium sp. 414]
MDSPLSDAMKWSSTITTSASSVSSTIQDASEGFHGYRRSTVAPFILHDLKKSETCAFPNLLGALLQDCCADSDAPGVSTHPRAAPSNNPTPPQSPSLSMKTETPHALYPAREDVKHEGGTLVASNNDKTLGPKLLDACLDMVLNTCKDEKLHGLLKVLCETEGKGKPRYAPFVQFANYALTKLESELGTTPNLKAMSDFKILFHVNDSKAVQSSGTGEPPESMDNPSKDTTHIPDIVLVPLATVQRAHAKEGCTYPEATSLCIQARSHPFSPREVLATVEMKWQYDPIRAELPQKYQVELGNYIQPINLSTMSVPLSETLFSGNDNSNDNSTASKAPSIAPIIPGESALIDTP